MLSGFKKIEVVDLDTIDVSNLNRQFLFRREHVGMSKAQVAAEQVKRFNHTESLHIVAHHGNIKDKKFGADFIQKFDLIFNALDNIEARRHVNRVCIAVDKPLIDGGTQVICEIFYFVSALISWLSLFSNQWQNFTSQGYDGQVVTIKRGVASCYDCEPKPTPKGFAVCTIRSTPDKPIHCIVWAKYLFGLLFGVQDDQNSITEGIDSTASVSELVRKLFVDDINKLIGMEDLWKSRKPPVPLEMTELSPTLSTGGKGVERSSLDDHAVWSLADTCAVLADRYERLRVRRESAKSLEFDKDDDEALDFVLCASNLRAHVFGIELQSAFRCKDIAGNIIPAIATTNAIIAGMMVMEAFKVIDGRLQDCKTQYKHREPTGRKSMILIPSDPDKPNVACTVCGGDSALTLSINTAKTPFRFFLERILKQELGLSEPSVDTGDNMIECYREFEDRQDEVRFNDLLGRSLSDPAVGIGHNAELTIEDEGQRIKSRLLVFHDEAMDVEGEKQYTLVRRGGGALAANADREIAAPAPVTQSMEDDGDDLVILDEAPAPGARPVAAVDGVAKRGREDDKAVDVGAGGEGGSPDRKRAKA